MTADISLETRDKLYSELKQLLDQRLEGNKYALLVAYEYKGDKNMQSGEYGADFTGNIVTNIDFNSPFGAWKGIHRSLERLMKKMRDLYEIPERS